MSKCFICKEPLILREFYINNQLTDSFEVCNVNINNHSIEKHNSSFYINIIEPNKSIELNLSILTKHIYVTEYALQYSDNVQRFELVNSFCFKKSEFKEEIFKDIINMLKKNVGISEIMVKIYRYKVFA